MQAADSVSALRRALSAIERWDHQAMRWVRREQAPLLIRAFRLLTVTGTGHFWILEGIFLFVLRWRRIELLPQQTLFLRAMSCALLTFAVGQPLKRWIGRRRPFEVLPDYESHAGRPRDRSFPSLHSGTSMSLFVALLVLQHPLAWPAGVWCVLVSFSRYYLGVHFPSDIVAGWALGSLCGSVAGPLNALLSRVVP